MNLSPLVQPIGHWLSTSAQRIGLWISASWQYISNRVSTLPLFISIAALTISSLHYYAVARHHRLSVKPHVNVIFYLEGGSERNGIYLANPGLGPAIIKGLSVEVGGKSYSAANRRQWQNVFHDLTLVPGCFRQRLVQSGTALKSGEEFPFLTLTHANPPVVDGHSCPIELLKFLRAEGLKVRIQYESMYGEPHETIIESLIDSGIISDIATAAMQQLMPKLVEKLQSIQAQTEQLVHRMQQLHDNTMKHTAALAERMLLHELYGNWWLWRKDRPMNPQD